MHDACFYFVFAIVLVDPIWGLNPSADLSLCPPTGPGYPDYNRVPSARSGCNFRTGVQVDELVDPFRGIQFTFTICNPGDVFLFILLLQAAHPFNIEV